MAVSSPSWTARTPRRRRPSAATSSSGPKTTARRSSWPPTARTCSTAASTCGRSISWASPSREPMSAPDASVPGLVEHLFRHEAGRLLAGLGRRLGLDQLDLAEEAVQDALVQALRQWPFQGVPASPAAWLARVAHNRALDLLRRRKVYDRVRGALEAQAAEPAP